MMLNKSYLKGIVGGGVIAALAIALSAAFILISRQPDAMQSAAETPSPSQPAGAGTAEESRDQEPIAPSSTGSAGAASQACAGNDRPVEFKRLSDEKNFPFVQFGRPVREDRADYDKYMASISRFPDVRSCLINSEQEKDAPNLTLFDWDKINGIQDADVCLFRVFSSIGSVEESKQWLESQGFTVEGLREIPVSVMRLHGAQRPIAEVTPGIGMNANWSIKKCGKRFSSDGLWVISPYSFSIGSIFSQDDKVDTVSAIYNTL